MHLKGTRWYPTAPAFPRYSLFLAVPPWGSRRFQPPAPPALCPSEPLEAWFLWSPERCVCRRDPGSSFWRGGLCTGRTRKPSPRPASSWESCGPDPRRRLPARFQLGFLMVQPVGGQKEGSTPEHPTPGRAHAADDRIQAGSLGAHPGRPDPLHAAWAPVRCPSIRLSSVRRPREARMGTGRLRSATPPPAGQSEAAGGARRAAGQDKRPGEPTWAL